MKRNGIFQVDFFSRNILYRTVIKSNQQVMKYDSQTFFKILHPKVVSYFYVDKFFLKKALTGRIKLVKIVYVADTKIIHEATQAQIAQLVEQRTENPRVTGSIPVLGIPV